MARFHADLVQAEPSIGDVKANVATVVDALRRTRSELVVFPELFLSGYAVRDHVHRVAEPLDGPALTEIARACRDSGRWCVVGFPRRAEARGVVHNSAALVGPDGVAGAYDKVQLPTFSVFEEDLYFKEGNSLPVFDTPFGRIGLVICYDLFFPECTKTLALRGADILVCPSASPTISQRYFETILPARAIETTTWLLYTNLVGAQDQAMFWGGAQAWGPRGDRKARGPDHTPATTTVEIDLDEVEEARRKRPALRDTRPEVLRELLEAGRGR
ncbi:MAG TPA: carbon-nitrogen hydrolase family protein [Candidatus Thermoplasmatota archaeon]|nr:carbon-nitrogen hydrolase family protein [Candidatus Thermoplasmatota archaeon]